MNLSGEQLFIVRENALRGDYSGINANGSDEVLGLLDTIADLQRQLADRVRERCLITGNLCGTDAQADGRPCMCNNCRSLYAYVQEKVDRAVLDFTISALDYFSKKSTTGQQGERGIYARTYQKFGEFVNSEYPKLSANRNKEKP